MQTKLINSVGINLDKFKAVNQNKKNELRKALGFDEKDFIIIYVAELIKNKRQLDLIKAIKGLKIDNIRLLIVGQGTEYQTYQTYQTYQKYLLENNLLDKVYLLGYRKNIVTWMQLADLYISPSE